ncbi:MAG: hypothetical protein KF782_04795 [Labilithrix sp.]|nr:hypothetical protein [Labilithrix sp.]
MKSTSVLAVAAVVALAAVACDKKKEPQPSETDITSAPIEREPVETTGGTMTTGAATDPGNTQGGGAALGTTESATGAGAGGTTGAGAGGTTGTAAGGATGTSVSGGRDGGAVWPAVPIDRKGAGMNGSEPTTRPGEHNTSTTLGDGTSGTYTGGKGTYGGKATHGTGTPTDGTSPSDKPATDGPRR